MNLAANENAVSSNFPTRFIGFFCTGIFCIFYRFKVIYYINLTDNWASEGEKLGVYIRNSLNVMPYLQTALP